MGCWGSVCIDSARDGGVGEDLGGVPDGGTGAVGLDDRGAGLRHREGAGAVHGAAGPVVGWASARSRVTSRADAGRMNVINYIIIIIMHD